MTVLANNSIIETPFPGVQKLGARYICRH